MVAKVWQAKELNLNGNKFTEAGWDMLAELIGPQEEEEHKLLPKLKRIFMVVKPRTSPRKSSRRCVQRGRSR